MATEYLEQTTTSAPYLKDEVDFIGDEARRLYDTGGITPYDKSIIPDMSHERGGALNRISDIASGGGFAGADQYQDLLSKTYGGDFLSPDSNPYISNLYDTMSRQVGEKFRDYTTPSLMSRYAQSGRMGGGLYQQQLQDTNEALGTTLSDMAHKLHYQNYADERKLQDSALRYAPEAETLAYAPSERLYNVGLDREAFDREKLAEERSLFEEREAAPYANLGNLVNAIGGNYGGTVTQRTPYDEDEVAKYMAYALAGVEGLGGIKDIFTNPVSGNFQWPWQCHTARLVFGEDNPEWVQFYMWKEHKAPKWFTKLYNKYTEWFAEFINDKPKIQTIVRNWMRSKING